MADMPIKVADKGASGGALGDASRDDLERGFTRLGDAESPNDLLMEAVAIGGARERPLNQVWTEHDAGGFLDRPHGLER